MTIEAWSLSVVVLVTLVLKANCLDNDYNYGDMSVSYDSLYNDYPGHDTDDDDDYRPKEKVQAVINGRFMDPREKRESLPLCCHEGEVYDQIKCIQPPSGFHWEPKVDGASGFPLTFNGFPECRGKKEYIQTYQKEVLFNSEGSLLLPYHIQLSALRRDEFCITKVYDTKDSSCEDYQTKVFTCLDDSEEPAIIMWTSVAISHFFIFTTLLVYFIVGEMRCLQGQYLICFLISLLIYNVFLLPASYLPMDISDVSCIALGAVKYFFFCGIFLWFNAICFDIWRTLRCKQDISGRRRFLIYSAYSWTLGAILTTVVLVLPYMKDQVTTNSRNDPLRDTDYEACKLKIEMNMILQIAQLISMVIDVVFLILASCYVCSYSKFGNGLPRCEASLCLKQGWKLFIIMIAHVINCIDDDIVSFPVPLWLYLLLESAAIFGVFAYRRTILKRVFNHKCRSDCVAKAERGSVQEKGQLTTP